VLAQQFGVQGTAVSEEYDASVAKLQSLQNRTPFPSAENNQRFSELTKEYQQTYRTFLETVGKMQISLESVTPQQFQDRLRAVVSEVEASAKTAGILLPESGFYMGFDKYKGQLPPDTAAAPLARQLAAIKVIIDRLIEYKVASIDAITRTPLPEETGRPQSAAPQQQKGNPPKNNQRPQKNQKDEAPGILVTNPFEIVFTSEQRRMRQSLNAIVNANDFFIIRNLSITNGALEGPPKNPPAQPAASYTSIPGLTPEANPDKPDLNVVVGNEKLTVAAQIEMITFNLPAPGSK